MRNTTLSASTCLLAFLSGCQWSGHQDTTAQLNAENAEVRDFTDTFGVRLTRTRLDNQAMRIAISEDPTYKIEVRQPLDVSATDAKNFRQVVPEISAELFRKMDRAGSTKLKPRWIRIGDHWFYGVVDKVATPERWTGVIVAGDKLAVVGLWLPKTDDGLSGWRQSLLFVVQTLHTRDQAKQYHHTSDLHKIG